MLIPMAEEMTGEKGTDVKTAGLKPYAERFLLNAGMSKETIEDLIKKIHA